MKHGNVGKLKPHIEGVLARDQPRRERRDVRQVRRWYFDEHKDRRWIEVKLPHRSAEWIWKVVRHELHGDIE